MKDCKNKCSVEETARLIGCTPLAVREGIKQKAFPFGVAIKGKGRYIYNIQRAKVYEYIGKEMK